MNGIRNQNLPSPVMCNYSEGNLITEKVKVARRWKPHCDVLLNGERGAVERNRIELKEDGKAVDPPTLDEIKRAVRELKNCKAA